MRIEGLQGATERVERGAGVARAAVADLVEAGGAGGEAVAPGPDGARDRRRAQAVAGAQQLLALALDARLGAEAVLGPKALPALLEPTASRPFRSGRRRRG